MIRRYPHHRLVAGVARRPRIAAERLADVPRLKASVTVVSDVVRIGDLIENAGTAADVAIFRSPDIGSTGSISAAKVLDAVGQHNLLIVDATGIRDVEITRVSRTISVRDIESRIARALAGQPGLGRSEQAYRDIRPRSAHDLCRTGCDGRSPGRALGL